MSEKSSVNLSSERLKFSGHETFAFRYGWLNKSLNKINDIEEFSKAYFDKDEAITDLGVGKNMAKSMRYWTLATQIASENTPGTLLMTPFGKFIYKHDPYLDHPASLWLIHWHLTSELSNTTFFYTFNNFARTNFDKSNLVENIIKFARDRGSKVSDKSIEKDVDCLINCYVQKPKMQNSYEESIECPLAELNLIQTTFDRSSYSFDVDYKTSMNRYILLYAIASHMKKYNQNILSLEQLVFNPGSPGRIFKLSEMIFSEYLVNVEGISKDIFTWVDTAGLKQLRLNIKLDDLDEFEFLKHVYGSTDLTQEV